MYPDVFVKFAHNRQNWGDVDVLPTPQFYYGMERGAEISGGAGAGQIADRSSSSPWASRTPTARAPCSSNSTASRARSIIRDRKLDAKAPTRPKADPAQPGEIGAPIPGVVSSVAVELNQKIEEGDRLLVMEAMKMQSTVYSPVGGTIKQMLVKTGQHVESKDLLLVIE